MKVRHRAHPLTKLDRENIAKGMTDPRGHSKSSKPGTNAVKFRLSASPMVYNSGGEPLYEPEEYKDGKRVLVESERAPFVTDKNDKPVMQTGRPNKPKRSSIGWSEKAGGWAPKKRR